MAPAAFDAEAGATNGHGAKPEPAAGAGADAGAAFVLESKGTWWHAGFHLTTVIVGPTVLTLPYALRGMGWGLGLTLLSVMAAVTFYEYSLMSRVLDHCEARGRRHIRFRELAADVLGSGWMFYFVVTVQTAINTGVSIGAILLAADCLEAEFQNVMDPVSRFGKPACTSASVAWNPRRGVSQQASFAIGFNSDSPHFNSCKIWEFEEAHQRWLPLVELGLPEIECVL